MLHVLAFFFAAFAEPKRPRRRRFRVRPVLDVAPAVGVALREVVSERTE